MNGGGGVHENEYEKSLFGNSPKRIHEEEEEEDDDARFPSSRAHSTHGNEGHDSGYMSYADIQGRERRRGNYIRCFWRIDANSRIVRAYVWDDFWRAGIYSCEIIRIVLFVGQVEYEINFVI